MQEVLLLLLPLPLLPPVLLCVCVDEADTMKGVV
jgi:hypothetical protein